MRQSPLTALGEDQHLEEIAMHLFEAASTVDARRAAEMLVRAGYRALALLAYEDAAERFERALEALDLAGAEDESGRVLLARGDALMRAGEVDAARAAWTARDGWHCGATIARSSRRRRSASVAWALRSRTSKRTRWPSLEEALEGPEEAAPLPVCKPASQWSCTTRAIARARTR